MENQTTISRQDAIQINKAVEVLRLLTTMPRMTQEKACANVGIDPKTYRKWIATQDEALISFEQARVEIERNELSTYLIAKNAIVNGLVADAMKPGVPISERIKALQHIEKQITDLSDRYHTVDVQAEQDLLNGPSQEFGTSKLANRVRVEEHENETIVRIKDKPEIIDAQATEDTLALEPG
jgi:hypothetical protein